MPNVRAQPRSRTRRSRGGRLASVFAVPALLAALVVGAAAPAAADAEAPNEVQAAYEVEFLQEMIAHHHMAVMMGEMCLARSAELRPDLVDLCQDIVDAQHHEIMQMHEWLAAWYGITDFHPDMDPAMEEMMERMAAMPAEEFTRHFLEHMIVHHLGALQPARQCAGRAHHDDLGALCAGMVEMQTAEIAVMQEWLCAWFGECRFQAHRRAAQQARMHAGHR